MKWDSREWGFKNVQYYKYFYCGVLTDTKIPNKDIYLYRYSQMSFKIGDLKDVAIFTEKYLC